MKKTNILLMVATVLLLLGCQKAPAKQQERQGAVPEPNSVQSTSSATGTATPTDPVTQPIAGMYKGVADKGACPVDFVLQVTGTSVKGAGVGTNQETGVSCNVTFNGAVDNKGTMSGESKSTYTLVAKGQTFEWYLEGVVSGTLQTDGGNLTIESTGVGHKCPENIPCEDPSDSIAAILQKS